ncbi:MAG: ribosome silencing factor [Planctomycetota bacterium]|nr:ribosome silencing factor [Planctomycetota bacterium]
MNSSTSSPADSKTSEPRSLQLALAAARVAAENNGRDIVVLDMRELTPIFDYFVVATGTSRRQLHAMSEDIDHKLEDDLNDQRSGIEGYRESRWILLDYGTVVIHLFDPEMRKFYALEDLWAGAQRIALPAEIERLQNQG